MEASEHKPGFVDGREQLQANVTSVVPEASPQIVEQRPGFEADGAAA